MMYRDRPVFPFEIDWSRDVNVRFTYDLRQGTVGFGDHVYEPLQRYATSGFDFSIELSDLASITRFERFFAATYGRQRGWWLPGPALAMEVTGGVSSTEFQIADNGSLTDGESALDYLFENEAGLQQAGRIAAIVSNGDGTATVTLTAALGTPVDETWFVRRLFYVRLERDDVELVYVSEGFATTALRVYELPLEYAAADLGERPAVLYHFSQAGAHWYLTSHDVSQTVGGHAYTPAPIGHGAITASTKATRDSVELESWRYDGNPLNAFFPFPPQTPMKLEISEMFLGTNTVRSLFSGVITDASEDGRRIRARVATKIDALARALPRFYRQKTCNVELYGTACGVNKAAYTVVGTITGVAGKQITVEAAGLAGKPANWWADGWAEVTSGGLTDRRYIRASAVVDGTHHIVKLNFEMPTAIVGAAVSLVAGCDRRAGTCDAKFGNYVNFQGHPFIPSANLMLRGIPLKRANTGGKK